MKGWKDDAGLSEYANEENQTRREEERADLACFGFDGVFADEWMLQITLPGVPIEEKEDWDKRAGSGELIAFERVVIVDRCECRSFETLLLPSILPSSPFSPHLRVPKT